MNLGDNGALTAGAGDDKVTAGNDDTIKLGAGADSVTMGTGDTVSAGSGQDRFRFTDFAGSDVIAGFLPAQDRLDFSSINPLLIVSNAALSGGRIATEAIAWLYQPGSSATIYVSDTGSALAVGSAELFEITLKGASSGLSASNFVA